MSQNFSVLVYWSSNGQPISDPIAAFWLFGDARRFCEACSDELVMIGEVEAGISSTVFRGGKVVSREMDPLETGEPA